MGAKHPPLRDGGCHYTFIARHSLYSQYLNGYLTGTLSHSDFARALLTIGFDVLEVQLEIKERYSERRKQDALRGDDPLLRALRKS